jgi:hypothetical protein
MRFATVAMNVKSFIFSPHIFLRICMSKSSPPPFAPAADSSLTTPSPRMVKSAGFEDRRFDELRDRSIYFRPP